MSRTVVLLAASLIFPRASFCGENYRIEPGQSAVTFSVRHMVLTTVLPVFGHSAANPTNESALPQVRRPYPSRARRCPS
jgi:hypothetical protein